MILSTHFLVGSFIASKLGGEPASFLLSFASHFVLDAIPHREYAVLNIVNRRWKQSLPDFSKVLIDISLGIFLSLLLFRNPFPVLLGGFFGILPDGISFLSYVFPKIGLLSRYEKLHDAIQGANSMVFLKNFSQLIILLLVVLLG